MATFANLEPIGNTPVVKIGKLAPAGIDLFVKIEAFNPLGSVKDRLALGVIEDAERRGVLRQGQTVVAPFGLRFDAPSQGRPVTDPSRRGVPSCRVNWLGESDGKRSEAEREQP